MINDNKSFVGMSTDFVFQVDYFLYSIFNKFSFSFYQVLFFFCSLIKETRANLAKKFNKNKLVKVIGIEEKVERVYTKCLGGKEEINKHF